MLKEYEVRTVRPKDSFGEYLLWENRNKAYYTACNVRTDVCAVPSGCSRGESTQFLVKPSNILEGAPHRRRTTAFHRPNDERSSPEPPLSQSCLAWGMIRAIKLDLCNLR